MKYALCAAACAVAASTSQAASVIADGSFEGAATTTTLPVPWVGTGTQYGQDTAGALGSADGTYRVFTGNGTDTIHQVSSHTIQVGDVITLDFWVNSVPDGRGFTGTLFWTNDGGATRTPLTGTNAAIALVVADGDTTAWEQANAGALAYTVTAGDAGIDQTLGVEFLGTAGFKGLDLASVDVVPEPGAFALLGLGGLGLMFRRRRNR